MTNERQEMLEKSATLYFGPWYRQSPYFKSTLKAGCTSYDIYNHMYLPGYYDDPEVEYWALNDAVCLCRLPAIVPPVLDHHSSLAGGPVFGVHYTHLSGESSDGKKRHSGSAKTTKPPPAPTGKSTPTGKKSGPETPPKSAPTSFTY